MAMPITLCIARNPAWSADDVLELEVNGQLQPDRIVPWGPQRRFFGFGRGLPSRTPFGRWVIPGNLTLFGQGRFGQGQSKLTHTTLRAFVAGDYTLRLRSRDARRETGNVSDWSDAFIVEHRPAPPAPRNLRVTAGVLAWDWSDPA